MNEIINWRHELNVIGRIDKHAAAITLFLQNTLQNSGVHATIEHKLNLTNGGLDMAISLYRTKDLYRLMHVDVPVEERMILANLQKGLSFDDLLSLIFNEVVTKMIAAAVPIAFREWLISDDKCVAFAKFLGIEDAEGQLKKFIEEQIAKQNAAASNQAQTHGESGQDDQQKA